MPYDVNRINEAISKGVNAGTLQRARFHQSRLKFHTERRVSSSALQGISLPLTQFMAMAENILPHDKFKVFQTLFRYPIKTNEITGVCFDKLSRIFDGRNPSFNYQFSSSDERVNWEEYRRRKLREPEIWQTKGWEFFKSDINSVLVVDVPATQEGELPEPYFYWLPIDDVITYRADPDTGVMDFIVFRRGDKTIVLDDASYRVWRGGKGKKLEGLPELEAPHDLGYCPARFFWNEPISLADPDVKASPLTAVLESLDWFEFFHISKRQLDLMGAYPILSGYEQACDFSNADNGDYCDGGYLRDREGRYKLDLAGTLLQCPKCGNRRIVGAGSFVEIPIPNEKENVPDLREPVQILSVDRAALDYNVNEEQRLRNDIITAVVGQDEIVTDRDAFNEQQVRANFESVTTVLNRIKKGFEDAQRWVDETICRLRYADAFISAQISYGNEFFLYGTDDLRRQYAAAKEGGASESELDLLHGRIIETEYRNDPEMLRRMRILADLEPFRDLSRAEVQALYDKQLISREDMLLKINFPTYLRRFERENINVLAFGQDIDYTRKIDAILAELRKYAQGEPFNNS